MQTTIVSDDENTSSGESVSVEREIGALENEVEHIAEDVENVEEKLEEIQGKLEWNSQEKQAIFQRLDLITEQQKEISERLTTLETLEIEELLDEAEDGIPSDVTADDAETVTNDLELPTQTPDDSETPTMTAQKPNLLKRLLFG